MNNTIEDQIQALALLRLPELQARYAAIVGEPTRCPNKTWLLRRLGEALERGREATVEPRPVAKEAAPVKSQPVAKAGGGRGAVLDIEVAPAVEETRASAQAGGGAGRATPNSPTTTDGDRPDEDAIAARQVDQPSAAPGTGPRKRRAAPPDIDALQARYLEVVGRASSSRHAGYLKYKIRQAEHGRIAVGPRPQRGLSGEAKAMMVLPLRMAADIVARLDEARQRLGLKSRMDLFRRALGAYLEAAGEKEVAGMVVGEA